jgi:hypothetical protein
MSYASPNVLCVDVSSNAKLGPIPATYSASKTCPDACPLKDEGCYAGAGFHTGRKPMSGHGLTSSHGSPISGAAVAGATIRAATYPAPATGWMRSHALTLPAPPLARTLSSFATTLFCPRMYAPPGLIPRK